MSSFENTTGPSLNVTSDSATWLLRFSLWPLRIVCPLLILICPATNWACIRIFQSRIYARSSSKWYFINIAIFDTIYVFVTAPLIFLISLDIYILNWHRLLCKSVIFLNYLSCQISAGLLACLSIDRLVATSCLSVYRQSCTTSLSKGVCLAVILVFSTVNSHYLIGYTIDSDGYCGVRHYKWYEANYSRLSVVYLLSYSIIPFTIITICNLFIVLSVCQNKTNMRKKYEQKRVTRSSSTDPKRRTSNNSSLKIIDRPKKILRFEAYSTDLNSVDDTKHEMFVAMEGKKTRLSTTSTHGKHFDLFH